jgi:CHAT domain-containing protein/tetratricopeptide (TPR) repeat protein
MCRALWIGILASAAALRSALAAPDVDQAVPQRNERTLSAGDSQRVDDLLAKIEESVLAEDFGAAINAAEAVLQLRIDGQGVDHWETVNAVWELHALRHVAALPADLRTPAATTRQGAIKALEFEDRAEFAAALPLRRERLAWCEQALGEHHPETSSACNKLAQVLNDMGRLTEAEPLYRRSLAIVQATLGDDHPETGRGFNNLASWLAEQARYAEAHAMFERAIENHVRVYGEEHKYTAHCLNGLASVLGEQGDLPAAEALCRRVLAIRERVCGPDHIDTGISHNNLAHNLHAQARYDEAQTHFQRALDVIRTANGEQQPSTASAYSNLGANLRALGKNSEAAVPLQKALDIRRATLGEDHPDTALSYSNIAGNLLELGRPVEAEAVLRKTLQIRRKAFGDQHLRTAQTLNDLGGSLAEQGRHAEAETMYRQALDIRRAWGEEHPDTASGYNNVATCISQQGRFAEAEPLLRMALRIRRKVFGDSHVDTALSCNNLASNLTEQEKYEEAEALHREAIAIWEGAVGRQHPSTALSYNNLAVTLNAQRKFAEAEEPYQLALEIREATLGPNHPTTADSCNNVAYNMNCQGRHAEAELLYRRALAIWRTRLGEQHPSATTGYFNVALNLFAQGTTTEARELLIKARDSYEAARLRVGARGFHRADFGTGNSPYPMLAAAEARAGNAVAAWQALELNLARGLLDEATSRRYAPMAPADEDRERQALTAEIDQLQPRIAELSTATDVDAAHREALAGLLDQRMAADRRLAELAARASAREVADLRDVQASLEPDAALVGWVEMEDRAGHVQEHWVCLVRREGEPIWKELPGTGEQNAWQEVDGYLARFLRMSLDRAETPLVVETFSARLTEQRLSVLLPHLEGIRRLYVTASYAMAGVPVELLVDSGMTVSYVHSGTQMARLRSQRRPPAGTSLLALGDAVYELEAKASPRPTALPPGGLLMTRRVDRGQDWSDLPGTKVEVARLSELFPFGTATVLTDSDASEQRLRALQDSGELSKFRYLHIAAHGEANDAAAFQSALILSQDQSPTDEIAADATTFDGRLTAREILDTWTLDADLVTLSACESGLGHEGGGDGLLGFAQALLLAGSRSICLSLWKVDDTATALLMDRFYQNLLGKRPGLSAPMPKAEALAEAKQWLRDLPGDKAAQLSAQFAANVSRGAGRKTLPLLPPPVESADPTPYSHPRFWAAFVLIGDPD